MSCLNLPAPQGVMQLFKFGCKKGTNEQDAFVTKSLSFALLCANVMSVCVKSLIPNEEHEEKKIG